MTHRLEFSAMGCKMLGIVDSDDGLAALDDLPAQFEEWEQALSRFRFDSELCALNRNAGKAVTVSQVLWDVFEVARKAEIQTGGLVNPLIADALIHAGYDESFDLVQACAPYADFTRDIEHVPMLKDVTVDCTARTICLHAGAQLDFGGIAKGWAAHQTILRLSAFGPALFSAGGDIAISDARSSGESWEIGVEDPFHPGAYVEMLYLGRGGVATSGRDYRHWTRAGIPQHHIIDPRTTLPAKTDVLTATVIAPTSMQAEALAKAVIISGSEAGLAWLDSDIALAGLLILEDGRRLDSRNLGFYL